MFTVVIAEQEHISSVQEYHSFLKPFLTDGKVAFCRWNTDGHTLAEAVPELVSAVARNEHWRAVVVINEQGLTQRNPFDLVSCDIPEKDPDEDAETYLATVQKIKFRAYEEASQLPLPRLMAHLCAEPLTSGGTNSAADEDPEIAAYKAEATRKSQLRSAIVAGEMLTVCLPEEVLCIAKRTCPEQEYSIRSSWIPHVNHQYTRFYDWNLYFDKMRYLVFDIVPRSHQNYTFDYIRFLYAVLLFANNSLPKSSLLPRRLYAVDCVNDEAALRALLEQYEGKLIATDELLERKLSELSQKQRPRLSDSEAESIFCGKVTVPVTIAQEFDEASLYVQHDELGLSTDCPESELGVWEVGYQHAQKALFRYLKQPRRALKRASDDLRNMNMVDTARVRDLNSFQLDDVAEHIADEELNMVSTATEDFSDIDRYKKNMAAAACEVETVIETRMTRKTTLALAFSAIGIYLLGYLSLIFTNLNDLKSAAVSLLMIGVATVLFAAVGLVCLFFLRAKLHRAISDFNEITHGLVDQVANSMQAFSKYLSHACNVMRGNSVLNYYSENEDPESQQARVLKKHRMDILRCREELHEVFGQYLTRAVSAEEAEPYLYNFSRPVDYPYPFPYTEGQRHQIEFLQPGNLITIPVNFVHEIAVRMEELYD